MNEITKEELKVIIENFMDRWDSSTQLGWKDLLPNGKRTYQGFTLKISFGQGVRISGDGRPWIAFLKYNQTVSQGVYPIIGYRYKEEKLDVLIGTSFQNEPEISEKTISLIEDNNMYLENSKDNIDAIINQLDSIMKYFDTLNFNHKVSEFIQRDEDEKNMNIKNIILYGPPGVGKTHNYQNLISMIEENKSQKEIFNTISNSLHVELGNDTFQKIKDEKRVEFITFHQSYSYEDFIEGFRPNENGLIELEDGVFKIISDEAQENMEYSNGGEVIDFDSIITKFQLDNEIGSELKTFNQVNKFTISKYTQKSIHIRVNENIFSISYSPLKELYEINKKQTINNPTDVVNAMSGRFKGLATYYFSILREIVNYKNINKEKKEQKNYYIVVDEINRGNISKIFGELITLIEEDKRDDFEVTLPYSKTAFKVPSNLYIIATMNSTDKSIATIDIALRRRFTFLKMKPSLELVQNQSARDMMKKLNDYISEKLDEDYQLGHSYFMKIQNDEDLEFVKEYKIKPLLEEYFYAYDKSADEILAEVLSNG